MKLYRLFAIVFLVLSCQQNERNCTDFKTGTFTFNYAVNGEEKIGRFKRTEAYSIDYYEGKTDSSSIRWINDCEFVLKKIKPKSMAEKDALHFKILYTTDSSYVFEYKYVVKKANQAYRVEKGEAFKLKP